jgi:hypothetical protein
MAEVEGFTASISRFCGMLRQGNIHCIDEDDPRYVLYAVRVPSPRLDDHALMALDGDDTFAADLAAWLADRAARLTVQA